MNRLRKPALMHALLGMAAAWGLTFGAAGPAHAQTWSEYAMVSATMGVSDGRVCVGEGSRGDIGCPTYAPYVDAAKGWVGIGTSATIAPLTIQGESALIRLIGTGDSTQDNYMNLLQGHDTSGNLMWYIGDGSLSRRILVSARGPSSTLYPLDFEVASSTRMRISPNGGIIMGAIVTPTTQLDVRGSLRLSYETSTTLQTCDANRTGAIKYQSGDFFYCRNGTAWESLTSLSGGGGTAGDLITSGTTGVYTYANSSATIATAGVERVVVGTSGNVGIGQQPVGGIALSTSGTSYFNGNVGIGTNTPEAPLHVMQEIRLDRIGTSPGINMRRAGGTTGSLAVNANNSALGVIGAKGYAPSGYPSLNNATIAFVAEETFTDTAQGTGIRLETTRLGANSRTERMRISADGNIGIGTTSPVARLDVSGTVSATLIKLANDPADACTTASIGTIKSINGRIYVCRQ